MEQVFHPTSQPAQHDQYPTHAEQLPSFHIASGQYEAAMAHSAAELDAILRLRYEVFNIELGEGLDTSHAMRRDVDLFDAGCHHLLVRRRGTDKIVGTYRMQTRAMAEGHCGFYSATEFDLASLPDAVVDHAVELGRACIAKDHRSTRVLHLLWRGIVRYLLAHGKRYAFGCCSLTSQDPSEGKRVMTYLEENGYVSTDWTVHPLPAYRCYPDAFVADPSSPPTVPRLMQMYLDHQVKIAGPPAIDRDFKTIDYLAFLDLEAIEGSIRRAYVR